MKINNFQSMHLSLLAALGLTLACAVRPGGADESETEDGDGDGDSGDGDSGDGDGDSGDGDTGEPYTCENPQPVLQADTEEPSGFVMCADGFIHRSEKIEALDPVGADSPICAMGEGGSCMTGADCIDQPYGRCVEESFAGCFCDYGCATDADCNEGYICAPAGVAGDLSRCIRADYCTVDEDCESGGLCGLSAYEGCCGMGYAVACADADEACHVNSECGQDYCDPDNQFGDPVDYQCVVQSDLDPEDGDWSCQPPGWCNCDCGRPFFVEGELRVADTCLREDWAALREGQPRCADLDPGTREDLAAHWAEIAAFEHASVASFARFAAQLLELGAPPRLVRDTRRALVDEIEHARLAFGLASAYAGAPLGPGALDVRAAASPSSLEAIVEGLIVEACVGETLAALEAREAALWAEDPAVAAVLEQIADDEWRHAELGWRSLAWLLAREGEALRPFVAATFARVLGALDQHAACAEAEAPGLRVHGVLDEALRAQLRRAGVEEIIRPCVEALAQPASSSSLRARA